MKNKKVLFLFLVPVSFLLIQAAKYINGFAEYYALKIYPSIASAASLISSKVTFSVAEAVCALLLILVASYIIVTVIKTIKNKTLAYAVKFMVNMAAAASILYFTFVLFCGINYYRSEFTSYSGLEIKQSTKEDLVSLCEILISDANDLRSRVKAGKSETAVLDDESYYGTAKRAQYSLNKLSDKYEVLKGSYPAPKPVIMSKAMSNMRITGIFFPFTFESNVNIDIPPFEIPSAMCHELVHLRGFMREDEANFLSYLACIDSDYDDFAYSGTLLALVHSMNALYEEDRDSFVMLSKTYSEGLKNDLVYSSQYWRQFDTKAAEISDKVNDAYLKANNQADGVKSYGRMVDLLLAYYR
jgi:hypothetical protein